LTRLRIMIDLANNGITIEAAASLMGLGARAGFSRYDRRLRQASPHQPRRRPELVRIVCTQCRWRAGPDASIGSWPL
jgi:hypothetical protein